MLPRSRKLSIPLLFLALQTAAVQPCPAFEVGTGWEFDDAGDTEGWVAHRGLSGLTVADGRLTGAIDGYSLRLTGPQMDLPADRYGTFVTRLSTDFPGDVILGWDGENGASGSFRFKIDGNGLFQEYEVPLHTNLAWAGRITRLSFTLRPSLPKTDLKIAYMRVGRIGVRLAIEKFRTKRIVPKPAERVPLELIVRNTGDVGGRVQGHLSVSSGVELLSEVTLQPLGEIEPAAVDTTVWIVRAREVGDFQIEAQVLHDGEQLADSSTVLSVVDRRWEQEDFILSAWSPPRPWEAGPLEGLAYYGEANFPVVMWVSEGVKTVGNVASHGMRCFVNVRGIVPNQLYLRAYDNETPPPLEPEHWARLDDIVDRFADNPTVIGYFVADEPNHKAFENLGKVVAHIRRRDPTKLSYVNQHPGSAGPVWFGPRSYRELLEHQLDVVGLEMLSYDRYNFFKDADSPEFFRDLATVRQVALDYDVPFANVVQAGGPGYSDPSNWRRPNRAEHRWLAYNTLAYGGRGLIWYQWFHRTAGGVITSEAREELAASLQSINGEVNVLGSFMMQLKSVGVYHVGDVPLGGTALPDSVLVASVDSDANMVIGLFEDDTGNDYFMIVNDYRQATTATVTLRRYADELLALDAATGAVHSVQASGREFEAAFRPGAGRLYFFSAPTRIEAEGGTTRPAKFVLRQNYPNPFNSVTTIAYDVAADGPVKLTVYDALGQVVEVLVDDRRPAGRYAARWSATGLASGMYVYLIESSGEVLGRRMVLIK